MSLVDEAKNVKTREDFYQFSIHLAEDFKNNQRDWENLSINDYLLALGAWVKDMDGYYKNQGIPLPEEMDWSFFATVLLAAKVYE
ncbi:hypothetical protein [Thermoactinomyces sp. DSM 45892]|uniref:DUF7660 family protein n=1 Tax=Thermoactinomyces sp. DSM 45892 TaxID=1882753 RepID=UPI00089492D0|nr:hypothetical protein [Thermoactinomyces sp. DSM 45892]SDZ23446.1 hypothetical protein SAMN05444416_11720 [Thermoactinomyces sp. DSM 45892]